MDTEDPIVKQVGESLIVFLKKKGWRVVVVISMTITIYGKYHSLQDLLTGWISKQNAFSGLHILYIGLLNVLTESCTEPFALIML